MDAPRVAVIGQGYVGLPLAMAAVSAGNDVVGFDTDKRRVDNLVAGRSYAPLLDTRNRISGSLVEQL